MKKVLNRNILRDITLLILSIGFITGVSIQAQAKTVRVLSVKISKTKDTLIVERADILKITKAPSNPMNKAVKWYCSNKKILKVRTCEIYDKY